jgi:hypothetical protein
MTRFYFHAATSGQTGLPTTEQSSLTVDNNGDAATVNRQMDTTKGTSETSISCATNASTSAQVSHFTRFVSKPFAQTSITAQTWNLSFAVDQSNVNTNFPVSGAGKNAWVSCYVWNPGTQTKVGNIIDGLTANGDWDEPTTAPVETVLFVTFAGSAVNSIPPGCIIVWECMFQFTQNNATARTINFFFDGPTVDTTSADTPSNDMASFLETPQALTFQTNIVKAITSTVTIATGSITRSKGIRRPITSTVTTSTASLNILRKKIRPITTTVVISSTPSQILAHNIVKAVPAETVTISSTPTQLRSRVRVINTTVTISSTPTFIQVPNRPFRKLTENITINSIVDRKGSKRRSLLN